MIRRAVSICSMVVRIASSPVSVPVMKTDQNCPPTRPARRRCMSVISGFSRRSVPLSSPSTLLLVILAQRPRQVVVPVDQRGALEDPVDPRLDLRVDRLRGSGGGDEGQASAAAEAGFSMSCANP